MNGEQKPLEKTLSLMGMDILDDETRKNLNGMMRQAIQADATETAPAKYMVVSGLTSYCVGAWLFSLSGDWNALFAVAAKTLADGLAEQIRQFVSEHPDTVLVAVDTFSGIFINTSIKVNITIITFATITWDNIISSHPNNFITIILHSS